jgi:hypothetical protein
MRAHGMDAGILLLDADPPSAVLSKMKCVLVLLAVET